MSDITGYFTGENVDPDGQNNWRGDQVSVTPGGQSIYKTSSVKLTQLGSRKVVGDRVFRYALSAGTIAASELVESAAVNANVIKQTLAEAAVVGGRKLKVYAADAVASGVFDDGYIHIQTTGAGVTYQIKSQPAISSAGSAYVTLYSSIATTASAADLASLLASPYSQVVQQIDDVGTAGHPLGVAPISVVSGDYFWLQTWGPCAVSNDATPSVIGQAAVPVTAGVIGPPVATTGLQVGWSLQVATGAEKCLTWLTLAP